MSPTVLCLVFSLAGVSQAPGPNDSVASPERQKALLEQIHRRNSRMVRGQTEFQVNLKLGLTPCSDPMLRPDRVSS